MVCFFGIASAPAQAGALLRSTPPDQSELLRVDQLRRATQTSGDLTYRGGPVITSLRTHAVFWEPGHDSTAAAYKQVIDAFFANVAAASGSKTNVYAITGQYADASGDVASYRETFAGQILDRDPYPHSGCSVSWTSICLSDAEIQSELAKATSRSPRGHGNEYFVFLPPDVAVCKSAHGLGCSGPKGNFCAFHFSTSILGSALLYAVMPYPIPDHCTNAPTGGIPQSPNHSIADSEVNFVSHETIETLTDPLIGSWQDGSGSEIGDLCEGFDGHALGGAPGDEYNQVIHDGHYFLQDEWSDRGGGCRARPPSTGVFPPSASFTATPNPGQIGQAVSFDASGSIDAGASIVAYSWKFGDGTSGTGTQASHSYAQLGTYTASLLITDRDHLIGGDRRQIDVQSATPEGQTVASGLQHSCAVITGAVECWGLNNAGQLGNGTTTNSDAPVVAQGVSTATSVAASGNDSCTVLSSGGIDCWGDNTYGQLGNGTTVNSSVPAAVSNVNDAVQVSVGSGDVCAVISGGSVECWGDNSAGQLGDGSTSPSLVPEPVPGLSQVRQVALGSGFACALLGGGGVDCWGANDFGELGNGTTAGSRSPNPVSGLSDSIEIAAGESHACALISGGTVECWGDDTYGEIGDGTIDTVNPVTSPTLVSDVDDAAAVTAGSNITCVEHTSGSLGCFGDESFGALGNGTSSGKAATISPVEGITSSTSVAAGNAHVCAALSGGGVDCWGLNHHGELGDGTTTDSATPVSVTGL